MVLSDSISSVIKSRSLVEANLIIGHYDSWLTTARRTPWTRSWSAGWTSKIRPFEMPYLLQTFHHQLKSIQVCGKLKEHMNIMRLSAVVLFTGRMHKNRRQWRDVQLDEIICHDTVIPDRRNPGPMFPHVTRQREPLWVTSCIWKVQEYILDVSRWD
jgi:hypothetical protein